MLDQTSDQGRIIAAALDLAAERPWQEITLSAVAARAGLSLVALRGEFQSKGDIVAAFTRRVDDEVVRRASSLTATDSPRDRLFEVVMSRFDVLTPHKAALRSLAGSGLPELSQIGPLFSAQRWMLEAAGIGAGGLDGTVRAAGLGTVYASVFRIWLDDDDAGMARTMAALDRRLRRGESALLQVNGVVEGVGRLAGAIGDLLRRSRRGASSAPPPDAPAGQPPSTPQT